MDKQPLLKQNIAVLWKQFQCWEIPVHSLLAAKNGDRLWESYRSPYRADTPHRMFSITKSYTALAIGCLAAEGKLALDDPIVRFFPEYLPAGEPVHPFLAGMTIRHMLTMQTCHTSTTYKTDPHRNWVESFFITPPSHKSGQIFLYDTSASHTLAALVKKLSGAGVLNYLRSCFLDEAGFSKTAYIISDPFGSEMGGSGMMALPVDLLVTGEYLMKQLRDGTGCFADYLREAVSVQVPTLHSGQTLEERMGYGYQFWRIRNGFAMFGMGGQYVLFYPGMDLILVMTGDSQNIKGGNQKILDAVYETVIRDCAIAGEADSALNCTGYGSSLRTAFPAARCAVNGICELSSNPGGFTAVRITTESGGGILTLKHPDAVYRIPFGWGDLLRSTILPKYNQPAASSGTWLNDRSLLVQTQLCGECVGSITFMLSFHDDGMTLWMKKTEESYFNEFQGFAEGLWSVKNTRVG